jgi:hypothetical protein
MENERSTIRILNALTTFDLSKFDDRLRLQKLVFLARKLGHDLGYSYNWYARGPYSPSLTRILFSAHKQDQLVLEDFELNADEEAIVKELRRFLKEDVDNPDALELLASVWYFIRRRPYTREERNELIDSIVQLKPKFSKNDVEQAYDRIMHFRDS